MNSSDKWATRGLNNLFSDIFTEYKLMENSLTKPRVNLIGIYESVYLYT